MSSKIEKSENDNEIIITQTFGIIIYPPTSN